MTITSAAPVPLTEAQLAALNEVIENQEGGWVLSKDADGGDGGWTFGGVTANSYCMQLGHEVSFDQIELEIKSEKGLAGVKDDCLAIYTNEFVKPWMQQLPDKLFAPIFSAVINEGEHSVELVLQRAINRCLDFDNQSYRLLEDGIIGDKTIDELLSITAVQNADPFLQLDFLHCWMQSYIAICVKNPVKLQYLQGWHNRVEYWRTA